MPLPTENLEVPAVDLPGTPEPTAPANEGTNLTTLAPAYLFQGGSLPDFANTLSLNGEQMSTSVPVGGALELWTEDFIDVRHRFADLEGASQNGQLVYSDWSAGTWAQVVHGPDCLSGSYATDEYEMPVTYNDMGIDFYALSLAAPAPGYYSVFVYQAYSYQVRQALTAPATAVHFDGRSNCVSVYVGSDGLTLVGNGQQGSAAIGLGGTIAFDVANAPSTAQSTVLVKWSVSCGLGESEEVSTIFPYSTQVWQPGTSFYQAISYSTFATLAVSDCFMVQAGGSSAKLTVDGSTDPVEYLVDQKQTFDLYVSGFRPASYAWLASYAGSDSCSGTPKTMLSMATDDYGVLDLPEMAVSWFTSEPFSLRVLGEYQATNCVAFTPAMTTPLLTVDGETGPFLLDAGTEITLSATGLPKRSDVHLSTCDGTLLGDPLGATTSETGTVDMAMTITEPVSVMLRASNVTTNCLSFNVRDET